MLEAWIIGESDGGTVQLFIECGICGVRLPFDRDDDPLQILSAHAYCEHDATIREAS